MKTKTEKKMAYNLSSSRVYSFSVFVEVLKNHGLPNSRRWIRKMEEKGIIPSPRLPSAESPKARKVYTGKQIHEAVKAILAEIEK